MELAELIYYHLGVVRLEDHDLLLLARLHCHIDHHDGIACPLFRLFLLDVARALVEDGRVTICNDID